MDYDYEKLSDEDGYYYDNDSITSFEFVEIDGTRRREVEKEHSGDANSIFDSKDSGERQITFNHHGTNLSKGLKEQRNSGELLDLTLKVNEDGKEGIILVHGNVLAAHSPFVRAFLRNEAANKVIDMSNWSKEVIETLVDCMYDGVLKIKSTNYLELLESSDYLCLNGVSQECAFYMCEHVTPENCCENYKVACRYQIPNFREMLYKYILDNFANLMKENKLMQLPRDDFITFLKDDGLLSVNSYGFPISPPNKEMILFDLLQNYITQNKLYDLWPCMIKDVLRFGNMDKKFLEQLILLDPEKWLGECKEKGLCLKYLDDIRACVSSCRDLSSFNPLATKPRAGLPDIRYSWTHKVAYKSDFPEEMNHVSFDDVNSLLNELKSSGLERILYVTGMKLYTAFWDGHKVLSAIEVTYNIGKCVLHGKVRNEMDVHEFKLEPDERIVNIKGQAGWLLDCLCFETNLGQKFGPYGGSSGGERSFKPKYPKSYLVGLRGRVSRHHGYTYVRRLRFAWASVL